MSVYSDKRSPYYQFDFQIEGHRFHGSTKCTSRKDALKFEAAEQERARAQIKAARRAKASLAIDDVADRLWNDQAQYDAEPKATETNLARLSYRTTKPGPSMTRCAPTMSRSSPLCGLLACG